MYSLNYIFNEYLLHHTTVHPDSLGPRIGVFGFLYSVIYLGYYTLPHLQDILLNPMKEHGAQPRQVMLIYLFLMICSLLHNISYFALVKKIGATSTGVIQSIRAIAVFMMSDLLFSSIDDNQAFNYFKGMASFIVCIGIIIFSNSKK